MDFQTTNIYMFDEFEYEDDVFYSELRRQVLLLTAEDDEKEEELYQNKNPNKVNPTQKQESKQRGYYDWPRNEEDQSAPPACILNLWRTGNGTGVFIPQIAQSRRKNRQRRKKNERGRSYKRVEKMN